MCECVSFIHITLQTLSLRRALAPALRRDNVVATSPLSAEKNRADHCVLCGVDGGGGYR